MYHDMLSVFLGNESQKPLRIGRSGVGLAQMEDVQPFLK